METEENSIQLQIEVQKRIYVVRGVQVMVDRDLAELYGVDTSHLNRQVKRNTDRFPLDFMFQLTRDEFDSLRCQNVIANWKTTRQKFYVAWVKRPVDCVTLAVLG